MLLLSFLACDLFNPEAVGAFDCSAYCDQVVSKTETCSAEYYQDLCDDSGMDSACAMASDEQLSEYAAQGNEDWEGKSRDEMVGACNSDLAENPKTEIECQSQTAALNNTSCQQILSLIGQMGG
jgi:hypothetical protein